MICADLRYLHESCADVTIRTYPNSKQQPMEFSFILNAAIIRNPRLNPVLIKHLQDRHFSQKYLMYATYEIYQADTGFEIWIGDPTDAHTFLNSTISYMHRFNPESLVNAMQTIYSRYNRSVEFRKMNQYSDTDILCCYNSDTNPATATNIIDIADVKNIGKSDDSKSYPYLCMVWVSYHMDVNEIEVTAYIEEKERTEIK